MFYDISVNDTSEREFEGFKSKRERGLRVRN